MYQRSSIDDPAALAEAYAQLGADPGAGRRFALALVLAVVLVASVLDSVRWQPADDREASPVTVVLERAPTPAPTPPPTPPPTAPPTPLPRLAQVTPAPVAQRAAPHREAARGGAVAVPLPSVAPAVALAATSAPGPAAAGAPVLGSGSGSGTGTGAGSGTGAGAGTSAGNGSGGTGTGAVNAEVPCGFVEFEPADNVRIDRGAMYERIRAIVHFRDGHTESAEFPYEWVYPNGEQTDPWSPTNTRLHPNDPVPAQLPPAQYDPRRLPALLRYILDRTSPLGKTLLEECPTLRP